MINKTKEERDKILETPIQLQEELKKENSKLRVALIEAQAKQQKLDTARDKSQAADNAFWERANRRKHRGSQSSG
ncbi:hypothetical protein [Pasteuria penetrans]|uniref:hypothetical protein n=1 Tax=Pasteuria penetrans TaxID=86005 RepID=UPI0011EBFD84|nr:hypothetical protein [Pasteuria penetrans]